MRVRWTALVGVLGLFSCSDVGLPGSPDLGPASVEDPEACEAPPPAAASAEALAALARVNGARRAAGIPCARLVAALSASAEAHCAYLAENRGDPACQDPHVERRGCLGFFGAHFDERELRAGYDGVPSAEVVVTGIDDGDAAAGTWIDSIWHRTPVLSPWVRELGFGSAPGCGTMDLGLGPSTPPTATAAWPFDGQTDVPLAFDGRTESPPPAAPPAGWPSGYPITFYARGPAPTEHELVAADDGTPVAHQFLGRQLLLADAVVLYADEPLRPGTRYRARVAGPGFAQEVTFTTRP